MTDQTDTARQLRRWRSMLWSLVAIAVLSIALPSLGYLTAGPAQAQQTYGEGTTNPRADTWRDARTGEEGFTAMRGPYVTNELINNSGQNWRQWREGPLVTYSGWLLLAVIAIIALFGALVGRQKIEGGRSGQTVRRWSRFERYIHWFVAIGFIALMITGLSMLFGRTVLIPVFGARGFAGFAQVALNVHNIVGPAFAAGLVVMIVMWIKNNIPTKVDLEWFKKGGGLTGKSHPSAGKLNGGEKAWFWLGVTGLGLAVAISGFILDFPIWGQTRATMSVAHLVHAVCAVLWIGAFFGHAYIGTLGTEGVLEGMTTGRVDVNWAKQHHDLWYADVIARGERPVPDNRDAPITPSSSPRGA